MKTGAAVVDESSGSEHLDRVIDVLDLIQEFPDALEAVSLSASAESHSKSHPAADPEQSCLVPFSSFHLPAGASREAMVFPLRKGVFHAHDMCAERIFLSVELPSPRSFLFDSSKPPHDCTVHTYAWAGIHPSLRELDTVGFARYDGSPCVRQARRSQ